MICERQSIAIVFMSMFLCGVDSIAPSCDLLLVGQYECSRPKIDNSTQEIEGCTAFGNATIKCWPLPKIECAGIVDKELNQTYFEKSVSCRYTNGYKYDVAVLLSLFLGWLGIDRFYLGYPAIGLLKLCTFGICGIGALVDFMLISLQIVIPSDGSKYVIPYYGPRLIRLFITNDTYYKPVPD